MRSKSILSILLSTLAVLFVWACVNVVKAATTVTVSATVSQTVTCSTNIGSTTLGTLSSGAIATSTPDASTTVSCNDGLGCTLSVNDAGNGVNGGLATTTPAYLIPSPDAAFDATTTLVAGTEGYGIQATTTATGSGGAFSISSRYNTNGSFGTGNIVGKLTTTNATIASSTVAFTSREVLVRHKAAISSATQAGNYADTITYSCVGN